MPFGSRFVSVLYLQVCEDAGRSLYAALDYTGGPDLNSNGVPGSEERPESATQSFNGGVPALFSGNGRFFSGRLQYWGRYIPGLQGRFNAVVPAGMFFHNQGHKATGPAIDYHIDISRSVRPVLYEL